jgi:hypothetical protein
MAGQKFLESYGGQTTEALLALEDEYRIDSLVLAFEEAIGKKAFAGPITKEERYVLAVEALEREVNNGGYSQFFVNSSNEYAGVAEEALRAIGCPKTAAITRDALSALDLGGDLTPERMVEAVHPDNEAVLEALAPCDDRYFSNDEPIADRLFEWIRQNRAAIRVGSA